MLDGLFAVDYKLGDLVAFRGHDVYHSVLAVLPEEEGKAAKRFTVNFFSTDGQYDKERAAAKQPKKKRNQPKLSLCVMDIYILFSSFIQKTKRH